MAIPNWTSASITATEIASLAADKPLLGTQSIPVDHAVAMWTEQGEHDDTDRTLTTRPACRVWDGYPHLYTTDDNAVADDDWYFYIDATSVGMNFDFVALMGHNFNEATTPVVTLELDNGLAVYPDAPNGPDGHFNNVVSIPLWNSFSNGSRKARFDLDHTGGAGSRRYTDVRYMRLKIATGANIQPEIGELIIGSRCQLNHKPSAPFDKDALCHSYSKSSTISGVTTSIKRYERRFTLSANLVFANDTEISNYISFFRAAGGTFIWCYAPSTSPNSFNLMVSDSDELDMPVVDYVERKTKLKAEEQGPEDYFLDME